MNRAAVAAASSTARGLQVAGLVAAVVGSASLALCTCGDMELVHELPTKPGRPRGECSHADGEHGKCPCPTYTPRETHHV